jgi:glycosyltransferase involved in cell wall biosynthesis
VLFVEHAVGFGGSTVALGRLLGGLDRTRFRPHVVVAYEGQREHLLACGVGGIELVHMDRGGIRLSPARSWVGRRVNSAIALADTLRRATPYALRIRAIARARGVHLIHLNNNVSSNLGGVLAAMWAGIPCVVKQRSFEWHSPATRWLARRVERFMADTEAIATDIEKLAVPRGRIAVTYCPIDVGSYGGSARREAVRAELGIAGAAPVFGILGSLMRWKGQHVFLDAAAKVLMRMPGARALVVGGAPVDGDPGYEAELRRKVSALGLGEQVVFTGHRNDVAAVLEAIDVVVHASVEREPFGMVIAEAMAARKPVVASRDAGPMEIVADGVSGILVRPGDPEELGTAVLSLLADPALARRMGEAGRAIVEQNFTLERHVERTQQVYDEVLGTGSGPDPQDARGGAVTGRAAD